jgi:dTDP-4-dehydrorhamnose reductase
MARSKILLTGADGQLGFELARSLDVLGDVTAVNRARLDLASLPAVREAVRALRPTLIVNAAAYTAVDRAESEPDLARAVNALAVGAIAEEAKALGARVVHVSTDYVFSGDADRPYTEEDAASPQSVYGATKREGELLLAAVGVPSLCVRTSWVYAERGRNFVRTMLRLAREGNPLRVVADQIGSPTWARALAEAMTVAMARDAFSDRMELVHVSGSGRCSWFEFAQEIFKQAGLAPDLRPIPTRDYPTPARRPAFSLLDCTKAERQFGVRLPDWRESLRIADPARIP